MPLTWTPPVGSQGSAGSSPAKSWLTWIWPVGGSGRVGGGKGGRGWCVGVGVGPGGGVNHSGTGGREEETNS